VVQASLRIISSESDVTPPLLVSRINRFVYGSTPASKYATFFYAELDQQRRQLRYVNAGHNAPYLLRAAGGSTAAPALTPNDGLSHEDTKITKHSFEKEIEELTIGGSVVGMFRDMEYEEASVELFSGDVLLVFTDGVPEAHNPDDEEFG